MSEWVNELNMSYVSGAHGLDRYSIFGVGMLQNVAACLCDDSEEY